MSTGRLSKFTARIIRTHFKKAVINKYSVSQRRLGKKFKVHHGTICRQFAKMDIRTNMKRHPNTQRNKQKDHKNCVKNSVIFYIILIVL